MRVIIESFKPSFRPTALLHYRAVSTEYSGWPNPGELADHGVLPGTICRSRSRALKIDRSPSQITSHTVVGQRLSSWIISAKRCCQRFWNVQPAIPHTDGCLAAREQNRFHSAYSSVHVNNRKGATASLRVLHLNIGPIDSVDAQLQTCSACDSVPCGETHAGLDARGYSVNSSFFLADLAVFHPLSPEETLAKATYRCRIFVATPTGYSTHDPCQSWS
jgi:hypothetical protein